MSIIQIPHTHQKLKFQFVDMSTCKRSTFQINRLVEISNKEDFDTFVFCQDQQQLCIVFPEFACAFTIMWYDKSGVIHAERIGRRKVLNVIQ